MIFKKIPKKHVYGPVLGDIAEQNNKEYYIIINSISEDYDIIKEIAKRRLERGWACRRKQGVVQ